jgi:hypothetical protein
MYFSVARVTCRQKIVSAGLDSHSGSGLSDATKQQARCNLLGRHHLHFHHCSQTHASTTHTSPPLHRHSLYFDLYTAGRGSIGLGKG